MVEGVKRVKGLDPATQSDRTNGLDGRRHTFERSNEWVAPQEGVWVKMYDPQISRDYYWNSKTEECVWGKPPDFAESGIGDQADSAAKTKSGTASASDSSKTKKLERQENVQKNNTNLKGAPAAPQKAPPKVIATALVTRMLRGEQKEGVLDCLKKMESISDRFSVIWKIRTSIDIPTTAETVDGFYRDLKITNAVKGKLIQLLEKASNGDQNNKKVDFDNESSLLVLNFCKSVRDLDDPLDAVATAMLDVERNRVQNAWSRCSALCFAEEVSGESEHEDGLKKYERQCKIDLKKLRATAQAAQDRLKHVMQDGYEMGYINESVLEGKNFFEWHKKSTQPAIDAVQEAEVQLQLVKSQIAREVELKREMRESICMRQEEKYGRQNIKAEKEKLHKKQAHEKFINSCRGLWETGSKERNYEREKYIQLEEQQLQAKEVREKQLELERRNQQKVIEGSCLTPWEGAKVGCSIKTLEALIEQETARRRNQEGRDFHVDDRDHVSKANLLGLVVWAGYLVCIRFF
jgi:hypothetical protein